MHVAMFYHSLVSDWNHGNAHFLRGVAGELLRRGHRVTIYEPRDGWSFCNLLREHGAAALRGFYETYPSLRSVPYEPGSLDMEQALEDADLVLVHEWNEPDLVKRVGHYRRNRRHPRILFHDTHHRAVTAPDQMQKFDLSSFDGVLVYGSVLRDIYRRNGWADRVWVWHEAADTHLFRPQDRTPNGDIVWVGNWGDEERTTEIEEFLIEPVTDLKVKAVVYGVRYPASARARLEESGIQYRGWLANYRVPHVFSHFRATIHIPRRPYSEALPGIPTIRVFEALACGIPLVSTPWDDTEKLFRVGEDFLMARDKNQMRECLRMLLEDSAFARRIAESGRNRVLERHTCAHRVDQLMGIARDLGVNGRVANKTELQS